MKKMVIGFFIILFLGMSFYYLFPSYSKEEIINITREEYCEEGVPVDGKCKIVTSIPADVECPEDFPLNMDSKYCERVVSMVAERYNTCDPGFNHIGGRCISEDSYPKNDNGSCGDYSLVNGECKEIRYQFTAYKCPSGNLNEETHMCDFPDQKTPVVTCPEGYQVNNRELTCEITTYEEPKEREVTYNE